MIFLFVLCLIIPANFDVAGLNLSTTRLFVLLALIPLLIQWVSARAGGILAVDVLILFHAVWVVIALVVNHGMPRFAYGGMLLAETLGGFLIGRMLIRSASDYIGLFKLLLSVLLVLLPFAFYELVSNKAIMQDLSRMILGSGHNDVNHHPRMGFYRVQSVMQHPILFGVFCSTTVANAYFIWSYSLPAATIRMGIALTATFTSLSSGALLASVLQILMIGWGKVTGNAWKVLAMGTAGLYVFLSIASNRGPVVLLIETLTFNSGTGWTRIHIWRHGIDDVMRSPVFGIGLNDWTRPFWLADSVDNFWLLTAMRYGVVGWSFLAGAFIMQGYKVVSAKNLTDYEKQLRIGYMIGLISLSMSLATVHIWGPTYVLLLAYLGAGSWFYTRPDSAPGALDSDTDADAVDGARQPAKPRMAMGQPQYSRMRSAPAETPKTAKAPRRASPYSRTVLSDPKRRKQ
ncbi:MAG: O-antigen ligase family protein [Paracoccaceae bacterium]